MIKKRQAVVFVFLKGEKVLFEKRKRDQLFGNMLIFPGGKVEVTENYKRAVIREIGEEMGVKPVKLVSLFGNDNPVIGETGYFLWPFLITRWTGEIPKKFLDYKNEYIWKRLDSFVPKLKSVQEILRRVLVAQS